MLLINDFIQNFNVVFGQQIHSGTELFVFIYYRGGWLILFMFLFRASMEMFYNYRVGKFMSKFEWHFLAIDIPKENEQTPKAVENIFAHIAGGHQTRDLKEKYWDGQWQEWFSFEIVSIEGYIQFIVMTEKKNVDLLEAAIYAQYPDAEITEIEDYAKDFPTVFPNKEYNLWGTEFELVQSHYYPIRTYEDFEHSLAQDFKDPMAALLETLSRIGPGEQAWLQIIVFPIGQTWKEAGFALAKERLGKTEKPKRRWWHDVLDFPMFVVQLVMFGILGGESPPKLGGEQKDDKDALSFGTWNLTPGEIQVIKDIERKVSKIGFDVKVRFVYVAKKEMFNKVHVNFGIVGAFKQFTKEDSNGLKPAYKRTGTTAHYVFTEYRKNVRRTKIMGGFKSRSAWQGKLRFVLNTEELATIWHFPMRTVRTPLVQKTTSKRGEAPTGLPMSSGMSPIGGAHYTGSKGIMERDASLPSPEEQPSTAPAKEEAPPDNLPFV